MHAPPTSSISPPPLIQALPHRAQVREQENTLRMRGILTAELHGSGLKELLSPTRSLVYEGPVRLRVEGSLRPEWRAKRDYKVRPSTQPHATHATHRRSPAAQVYVFSDLMFIARQNLTNSGFTVKVTSSTASPLLTRGRPHKEPAPALV